MSRQRVLPSIAPLAITPFRCRSRVVRGRALRLGLSRHSQEIAITVIVTATPHCAVPDTQLRGLGGTLSQRRCALIARLWPFCPPVFSLVD